MKICEHIERSEKVKEMAPKIKDSRKHEFIRLASRERKNPKAQGPKGWVRRT